LLELRFRGDHAAWKAAEKACQQGCAAAGTAADEHGIWLDAHEVRG
jgi:hypothetical protein